MTVLQHGTFLWTLLESMVEVDGVMFPQIESPHLHF